MNKRQTEVEKAKLAAEKRELNHLRAIYKRSLNDVLKKIAISDGKISVLLSQIDDLDDEGKSILQSQIYQKKFQQNLQKQLDTFYSELVRDQHDSMQAYLRKCYDMGFVGSIYDMHGQGVPIISQISQKNVIKAMNINSKISTSLYQRLGEDVHLLKKKIANSISRGIATASSYSTIATNLAENSNVGINRAMRIARTEGHRIQAESALDAQYAARDAGADVVKQWDSTLDGRTRRSHRELDGQIRELDDPFEVGGKTAMHPSGFGIAGEDINCRCALLQRARWALDEDELQTLQERAEFFGLDKSKSFEDFQNKYIKAATASKETLRKATSGAISGALTTKNDPMGARREEHAKRYYESIRNSKKNDIVRAIVKNTELDVQTVDDAISHLFYEKHFLDKGYTYFDEDYDISESIRRLRTNSNIQPHDIILIKHEAAERELMTQQGLDYKKAHDIIEQTKYNYKAALIKFLKDNDLV